MDEKKTTALPKHVVNMAWVLVLGAFAPMLDATMVNIAVNDLARDFGASLSTIQWVITGYVLATAVAVPFAGWLVNRFSGKWVFLVAEIAFGVFSLASALAWNIDSLIVFRLFQGAAAGMLTPLLTTLLVDLAGSAAMGRLMAVVGLPIMLGPILGPVIGGIVLEYASWRWIFYINVPIVILATILIAWKLPTFEAKNRQARFDVVGVTLLAAISSTIIYGIVQASTKGDFTNATTVAYVLAGIALMVVYGVYAHFKGERAILPIRLFTRKNFTAAMVGMVVGGVATNGAMLLLPLFFQNLRGDSVIVAGLSLIPQGVGMLVARPIVGKLIDRIGARYVTIVSLAITLIGTIPFAYFDGKTAYWLVAVILFVRGIGAGGILSPLMTDAFVGGDKRDSGAISVASRTFQNIGGAFGSAVIATIVAGYMTTHTSIAAGYQTGFAWTAGLSLLIIIPAVFLTNHLSKK
ncbi:MDR family MFS transporter [Weissella cibaria]|uniref:MDR family MFS transporter n=1 Tax=Weissella cibaria TaxID=137591 RepID=UPI000706AF22|nr:MDR family MFS transporter [Weissella cibaria]ALI31962.1 MFS transporter [Weissella cibaria]MBD1501799.1 DHA2 family efflux MFS transporter permease subunit [Weissella cibaria]MCG4286343.1 multidrug efflux MFS transporter [Weissella cibaria]MDY2519760.1 MDR family MFS transporter [Weissella cibaria]WCE25372.1 MDR family MFS transporter [Weissella cibaria]